MGYIIEIRPDWAVERHAVPDGADMGRVLRSILACGEDEAVVMLPTMAGHLQMAAVWRRGASEARNEIATELLPCAEERQIYGTAVLMRRGGGGMSYEEALKWCGMIEEATS